MNVARLGVVSLSLGLSLASACTTNNNTYVLGNGGEAGMGTIPGSLTSTGTAGTTTTTTGTTGNAGAAPTGTAGASVTGNAGAAGTGAGGMGTSGANAGGMGAGGMGADITFVSEFDMADGMISGGTTEAFNAIVPDVTTTPGVATFSIPFTGATDEQLGWNIAVDPPHDGTGLELVARVQLVSGFVDGGGFQLYAFSGESWDGSLVNWTSVPATSAGTWVEYTLDLDQAAAMDNPFDKTAIIGVGFAFNTGMQAGATAAVFQVDYIGFRAKPGGSGTGGAGAGGTGTGGTTTDAGSGLAITGTGEGSIPAGAGRIWDDWSAFTGRDPDSATVDIDVTGQGELLVIDVDTTGADQSAQWHFDFDAPMDLTGQEIVIRIQRVSGFSDMGGVQPTAFSSEDGTVNVFLWNTVGAVGAWQELVITATDIEMAAADFRTTVGTVGIQINTGESGTDATPARFVIDWIGIRAEGG